MPNLIVALGLPFFCDITIVSPISRNGTARSGTSNAGGKLLERAERENNSTYAAVTASRLGALYCLGHEVYGRWHTQGIDLLISLPQEHVRGLPFRIKKGVLLNYIKRWSNIICVSLQKSVADTIASNAGGDISSFPLEPGPTMSGLFHT